MADENRVVLDQDGRTVARDPIHELILEGERRIRGGFANPEERQRWIDDFTTGIVDVARPRLPVTDYQPVSNISSGHIDVIDPETDSQDIGQWIAGQLRRVISDGRRRPERNVEGDIGELATAVNTRLNREISEGHRRRVMEIRDDLTDPQEQERAAVYRGMRRGGPYNLIPSSPGEAAEQALERDRFQAQYNQYVQMGDPTNPMSGEALGQHNLLRRGAIGVLEGVLGPYHAFVRAWEDMSRDGTFDPADTLAVAVPAAIPGARLPRNIAYTETNPSIMPSGTFTTRDITDVAGGIRTPQSIVDDAQPFFSQLQTDVANTNTVTGRVSRQIDTDPYTQAVIDQQWDRMTRGNLTVVDDATKGPHLRSPEDIMGRFIRTPRNMREANTNVPNTRTMTDKEYDDLINSTQIPSLPKE